MKIKNTPFVDFGEIGIDKMSITYVQPPDCNSDGDEQYITFETESVPENNDEYHYYYNVKMIKGGHWSFNDPEELIQLAQDFTSRLFK